MKKKTKTVKVKTVKTAPPAKRRGRPSIKKRGRPKKNETAAAIESQPKRKRGRPKGSTKKRTEKAKAAAKKAKKKKTIKTPGKIKHLTIAKNKNAKKHKEYETMVKLFKQFFKL